jgi:hypothetical protein
MTSEELRDEDLSESEHTSTHEIKTHSASASTADTSVKLPAIRSAQSDSSVVIKHKNYQPLHGTLK